MLARIRGLAVVLLASVALGCGGAYADAIARGDNFAGTGMWDEAAAAYEEAMRIDPNDPEAAIKLKEARRSQAADRLKRAEALEKRGELVSALGLVQEAVKFDPSNTDAQRSLTRINDAALDRAEQLVSDGKEKEAFELTSLVVKGSPHDPRARKLDDKVRGVLADKAHERAKAFLTGNKLGNALVELASCLVYRPDYPDAKLEFGQVKLKLEDELRYYVVLKNLEATGKNAPVGRSFKPELLAQAMDEKLLLRVVKVRHREQAQSAPRRGRAGAGGQRAGSIAGRGRDRPRAEGRHPLRAGRGARAAGSGSQAAGHGQGPRRSRSLPRERAARQQLVVQQRGVARQLGAVEPRQRPQPALEPAEFSAELPQPARFGAGSA